jgi:hypothetical protein
LANRGGISLNFEYPYFGGGGPLIRRAEMVTYIIHLISFLRKLDKLSKNDINIKNIFIVFF